MNRERQLGLACVVVTLLSFVIPAGGAVWFSDDFGSYTAGTALPTPYCSVDSRTTDPNVPASFNAVAGIGAGTGDTMYAAPTNPYTAQLWRPLSNPLDVANRTLDFTFYWKYTGTGAIDPNANLAFRLQTANDPQDMNNCNVGDLYWSPATPTTMQLFQGGKSTVYAPNLLLDGSWNKIQLHIQADSTSALHGVTNLIVNDVQAAGAVPWNLPSANGWDGIAVRADGDTATKNANWAIDNIEIDQSGLASNTPKSAYPGIKTGFGGIVSDGSRYIYSLGGSVGTSDPNTNLSGQLWRYDTSNNTWTQLQDCPNTGYTTEVEGYRLAYTTAGADGKLVEYYFCSHPPAGQTGPAMVCFAIDSGAATDPNMTGHWESVVRPVGISSWDPTIGIEGAGKRVFGMPWPSQGGLPAFNAETGLFSGAQGYGQTPPNRQYGSDMAYASQADPNGVHWMYCLGPHWVQTGTDPNGNAINTAFASIVRMNADQNPTDALGAYSWDYPGGQLWISDLPAVCPNPGYGDAMQHGLTYVDSKYSSVYLLHTDAGGSTSLYEVRVQGGALFAAIAGSNDLYRYDPTTSTWTTLADALPVDFGPAYGFDDLTSGLILNGDTDVNGVVDVNDLNNVFNTLGTTGHGMAGDTNGDGVVDVVDLNNVFNNLGVTNDWYGLGGGEIPEPATLSLLALGALALLRRGSPSV